MIAKERLYPDPDAAPSCAGHISVEAIPVCANSSGEASLPSSPDIIAGKRSGLDGSLAPPSLVVAPLRRAVLKDGRLE
jgi:hypothetical protein